jgi:hypothetical protein
MFPQANSNLSPRFGTHKLGDLFEVCQKFHLKSEKTSLESSSYTLSHLILRITGQRAISGLPQLSSNRYHGRFFARLFVSGKGADCL